MLVAMQPISKPNVVGDTNRKIEKLRRNPSEARQEAGKRTDDSVSGKGTELLKMNHRQLLSRTRSEGRQANKTTNKTSCWFRSKLINVSTCAISTKSENVSAVNTGLRRETFLKICTRQTYALSASNCAQPAAARRVSSQTVLAP